MADHAASDQLAEKTRALLGDLWKRNLPIVKERLDVIDRAAGTNPLPEELRIEAMHLAHKLAGSLGMFGFDGGTRIARQLELALDVPDPDTVQVALLARQLREEVLPTSRIPS